MIRSQGGGVDPNLDGLAPVHVIVADSEPSDPGHPETGTGQESCSIMGAGGGDHLDGGPGRENGISLHLDHRRNVDAGQVSAPQRRKTCSVHLDRHRYGAGAIAGDVSVDAKVDGYSPTQRQCAKEKSCEGEEFQTGIHVDSGKMGGHKKQIWRSINSETFKVYTTNNNAIILFSIQ